MFKQFALSALILAFAASLTQAKVQTKEIEYKDGDVELQGFLAWDDAQQGKRPGVLVVHEWWGHDDYARSRAKQLAELGYVAFALDMYGEGKLTEHPKQAGEWAGQIRANTAAWQKRALAGLEILKQQPQVDPEKLAAIGYCFGGSTALQLAFAGADLDAVVSFHGALPVPTPEQAEAAKASILVCHGAEDGFIPEETAQKFRAALDKAGADYQMVYYAGAKHSFTVPHANERGIDGIAYNRAADQRSWAQMQQLFDEVFSR